MIYSFSAENFYSIGNKIRVDLVSRERSLANNEMYLSAPFGDKITKALFIGGPNASGKTNVLRVLAFLKYIIVDSMTFHSIDSMDMDQCRFFNERLTNLSVVFSVGEDVYDYAISLTEKKIEHESLIRKSFVTSRASRVEIFSRIWNAAKECYDIKTSKAIDNISSLKSLEELCKTNPQASFISIFSNFDAETGVLKKIREYWRGVISNIQSFGNRETNHSMTDLSNAALRNIYGNKYLLSKITDILKRYDFGLSEIVKKDKMGPSQDQTIYGIEHTYGRKTVGFTVNCESSGTQRLLILLEAIMLALSSDGGAAVIDELDAFLHPDIFDEIISLFLSKNTNPNNAQLVFSAQNYSVLEKLDKQQIVLTEKNKTTGQTEAWRLDEVNGINSRDNFYLKYLTGAYGGVPKIG